MNCEKCKTKRATLFFADESGRRHALCATCGAVIGKVIGGAPPSEEKETSYMPSPTLTLLTKGNALHLNTPKDTPAVCRGCGLSIEEAKQGELGCPECYECFGALIFPTLPNKSSVYSARMPSVRRKRMERERRLNELRVELRRAVDGECFELAATIRDKIRELEKQR